MMTKLKQEEKQKPVDLDKDVMMHVRLRTRNRVHRNKRRINDVETESLDAIINHAFDVYEATL